MPSGKTAGHRPLYDPANPLIVQSDHTVLVEVDNPRYADARDALAPFAELEKSPEHIHTYRISDLSLWNAAAAGITAAQMLEVLGEYSKFPLPSNLAVDIEERVSRYGRVRLERHGEKLRLICQDAPLLEELARQSKLRQFFGERIDATSFAIEPAFRGVVKQALIAVGYPAEDLAGYTAGADLPTHLRTMARSGLPFVVRDYQKASTDVFHAGGDVRGGSGVIVLPCGAGKTIVGIAVMAKLQKNTLVLTTSITALKQWKREILDKTDLTEEQVAEYSGESKEIGPVTLATYPDPDLPARKERGISPLPAIRPARLGPDHLRRSALAARAGIPGDGPDSGPPAVGADGNAGARGWP